MKKTTRKLMSLLLTFVMVLSLLPAAWADSGSGLTNLTFAGGQKGVPTFSISPAFSQSTKDYTVTMPDYEKNLYCNCTAANDSEKAAAFRTVSGQSMQSTLVPGSWSWLYGLTAGSAGTTYSIHTGQAPMADSKTDTVYSVTIQRSASLSGLTVNDTLCPDFNKSTLNYTAGIPEDAANVSIKATAFQAAYTLRINDSPATSGNATELPLKWDSDGKMAVSITVSADGAIATTYKLTLIKETKSDTPLLSVQPQNATYKDTETALKPLRVRAVADGTLSYQWYSNTANKAESGTPLTGATDAAYTPVLPNVGTTQKHLYYYCMITNTVGDAVHTAASSVADITVTPDPTPTVTLAATDGQDIPANGYAYASGETAVTLVAKAVSRANGGTWNYQWTGAAGNGDNDKFTPSTASDRVSTLICTVTYTLNGIDYTTKSASVKLTVTATSAKAPAISQQPKSADYLLGTANISALTVSASAEDGGSVSYQWYSSTDNSTFTELTGKTDCRLALKGSTEEKTTYYRCHITNTLKSNSGQTYTQNVDSDVAAIAFKSVQNLGGKWAGEGTETSPYLLKNVEDISTLCDLVNKGTSFENYYFKLDADVTLPDNWVPMGALKPGEKETRRGVNLAPFGAHFDGGNHTVTVPENGKPLFGFVRHATVSNLNVYGKKIAGYGLVNDYTVDYGPTGSYGSDTRPTIVIDNVTLKTGSSTQKAGFIGGYASGMNVVEIKNSVIESGVTVGYDKNESDIGSFAGALNGTVQNCSSAAAVYGKDNVGGILGSKGQSMGPCAVYECAFTGNLEASGNYAGGIVGAGYNAGSAPQSPCVTIQNSYASGNVKGADYVGGIFGGEGGVKECWPNGIGYIQNNYFSGKVSGTGGNIGGVIGYMQSLNRYNIVSNNFYAQDCGAAKGIGAVTAVCTKDTPASGSGWSRFAGGAKYGRADDPTGADADKLAKKISATALKDGTLLTALNAGVNSSGNWAAGTDSPVLVNKKHILSIAVNGLRLSMGSVSVEGGNTTLLTGSDKTITVNYNDGTQETVSIDKAGISGFDTDTVGFKAVTVTYSNHTFVFELYVKSPKPVEPVKMITVSFTLFGDSLHGESGTKHTLKANNLTVWIPQNTGSYENNATVLDVLSKELSKNGYSWMNQNVKNGLEGNYIQSITNPGGVKLAEFSNGKYSGWMYTLNGKHPLLGVKQQTLKDGDVIVFHYTDDYAAEEGSEKWSGDTTGTAGKTAAGGSSLAPKASVSGSTATAAVQEKTVTDAVAAVQKSGEKTITIVPTDTGSAKNVDVSIPKTAVKAVVDGTGAGVEVDTAVGSVTIPNETLASIVKQAGGDEVKISVEQKTAADIADKTVDAKDAVIAAVTVASGDKAITSFGGQSLTVSIPVDSSYKAGQSYKVIILSANGTKETASGKCVLKNGKLAVEVETVHLSTFIVTRETVAPISFTDVKSGDWYCDAVQYAVGKGIFTGTTATTFEPNTATTRAMLVTVLYRMENKPAATAGSFTDVKAGSWYADAVAWAAANKLVTGYGDSRFGPEDTITREQMAAILMRYARYKKLDVSKTAALTAFTDAGSVSTYAADAMKWAVGTGLISGTTDTTLSPAGSATRAQAAAILMRFNEKLAK